MLMEHIAYRLTAYLRNSNTIEESEFNLYKYGILSGLELVLCICSSLLISLILGTTINSIIVWSVFLCVRSYIGGLHLKKYSYCFIFSILMCNILCIINKKYTMSYKISFLVTLISAILIFLIFYGIHYCDKKNYEANKYFFKKLIKNIAIILLAMIVLYKCELSEYVSQCAFTVFFICIFAILNRIRR